MTNCPKCGKECKNLGVHLRFCKEKKEETLAVEEGINFIPQDLSTEVTEEQVKLVQNEIDKPTDILTETENMSQGEVYVDNFNEGLEWKASLTSILTTSKNKVIIRLKNSLAHEFVDTGGFDFRYPSNEFYDLLREYCSSFETEDGLKFICEVKSNGL